MRALVIGASGQVGAALLAMLRARGHEAIGTYAQHPAEGLDPLDVTDAAAVERAVEQARPDWVLCPAALTPRGLLRGRTRTRPSPSTATPRCAAARMAPARAGAGFVYYSTDYVFDGESGPYAEDDPAAPARRLRRRASGRASGRCWALVGRAHSCVRTSVVYGPDRQEKNFVYQLIRACRGGQGIPHPPPTSARAPRYNPDLAAGQRRAVRARASPASTTWPATAMLDRFAFAQLVCRVFDLDRVAPDAGRRPASSGRRRRARSTAGCASAKAQAVLRTPLRPAAEGCGPCARDAEGRALTPRRSPARTERPLTSAPNHAVASDFAVVRDGDRSSIG